MYRNKHGVLKRSLFRLYAAVPATRRLKGLFLPFRAASFAKRLARLRGEYLAELERVGKAPIFNHLEIETLNRCNGECAFCPVNRHADPRPRQRMSEELFRTIIAELRSLAYRGEVCLYSNNESLLDSRIEDFLAHARKELPAARILLSSNGTLLTPERYRKIIDNVDLFYVNNYVDDFKPTPRGEEIRALAASRPDWWAKTHVVVRYRGEVMSSRGGLAPNKRDLPLPTLQVGCSLPATQCIIRPDGKVSLCCNDATGKMTLGDVARDGLAGVWWSEGFEKVRLAILSNRAGVELCRHCDNLSD